MRIGPPSRPPSKANLDWASRADWMIFTSQHAVQRSFAYWQEPPGPRIAAVGAATSQALRDGGWPVHWQAPRANSESLLDAPQAPRWQGRIAILAGSGGRRHLKQGLQSKACEVKKLVLYRRLSIEYSQEVLAQALQAQPIAMFSSGFGLRRWQELAEKHQLPMALQLDTLVASQRLCKLASQLGFSGHIQALPSMCDSAILTALNEWNHD